MTVPEFGLIGHGPTADRECRAGVPVPLTTHAAVRCAQRGLSEEVIGIILDYGRSVYDSGGGCRYFLGRAEKKHLARARPDVFKRFGRKLDCLVVVPSKGGEQVITTYVRNRR